MTLSCNTSNVPRILTSIKACHENDVHIYCGANKNNLPVLHSASTITKLSEKLIHPVNNLQKRQLSALKDEVYVSTVHITLISWSCFVLHFGVIDLFAYFFNTYLSFMFCPICLF